MNKKKFLIGFAVLFAVMALLACSDNATNETVKTEGDPNDPDFVQAQILAEAYVDTMFASSGTAFGFMHFDGNGPLNVTGDSLNINYDSETCWWEIYASFDSTSFSFVFIDSVRFDDGTGCQMLPDSLTTTQIEYRAYLDLSIYADSGSMVMDAEENVLVTGIQSDFVVLNASNTASIDMDLGFMSLTVDYNGTITDLTFNRLDLDGEPPVYPVSGSAAVAMAIETTAGDGSSARSWTVDITFYEDYYHAYAESGDNYWEWDVYYDHGPVM